MRGWCATRFTQSKWSFTISVDRNRKQFLVLGNLIDKHWCHQSIVWHRFSVSFPIGVSYLSPSLCALPSRAISAIELVDYIAPNAELFEKTLMLERRFQIFKSFGVLRDNSPPGDESRKTLPYKPNRVDRLWYVGTVVAVWAAAMHWLCFQSMIIRNHAGEFQINEEITRKFAIHLHKHYLYCFIAAFRFSGSDNMLLASFKWQSYSIPLFNKLVEIAL